jgi:diguanylate cyclase (GGDEF)-like protein
MRALSPLTGLPGNIRIQEEIRRLVSEDQPFALLYADLDHFKAYNDHYGFVRGDRAIQVVARLSVEVANELVGPGAFIGHVGGDDFILIVPPELAETVAKKLCERFDQEVPGLYDKIDADRGAIEIEDRQGNLRRFPLLTISLGVASTDRRKFAHFGEAVAVATELKQFAKREPRSSYALDRRTD